MSTTLDLHDTAQVVECSAPAAKTLQPWVSAIISLKLAAAIQDEIEKSIEEFDRNLQWRLLRIGNRE